MILCAPGGCDAAGGRIDAVYWRLQKGRRPGPELILRAQRDHRLDLTRLIFIGATSATNSVPGGSSWTAIGRTRQNAECLPDALRRDAPSLRQESRPGVSL